MFEDIKSNHKLHKNMWSQTTILYWKIYRGYLLFWGEYQIYFIECGEKNQYFSRVRSTSENADIFTARDKIYLVFAEKKSKFSFYFILNGNTEIKT